MPAASLAAAAEGLPEMPHLISVVDSRFVATCNDATNLEALLTVLHHSLDKSDPGSVNERVAAMALDLAKRIDDTLSDANLHGTLEVVA